MNETGLLSRTISLHNDVINIQLLPPYNTNILCFPTYIAEKDIEIQGSLPKKMELSIPSKVLRQRNKIINTFIYKQPSHFSLDIVKSLKIRWKNQQLFCYVYLIRTNINVEMIRPTKKKKRHKET